MRTAVAFTALYLLFICVCHSQDERTAVVDRYRKFLIANSGKSDNEFRRIVSELPSLSEKITASKSEHAKWTVLQALDKIRDVAITWSDSRSTFFHHDSTLVAAENVLSASIIFLNKYPDWSLSQWRIARSLCDIVMLFDEQLSDKMRTESLAILKKHRLQGNGTGVASAVSNELALHYAVLTEDIDGISNARDHIADNTRLDPVTEYNPTIVFFWRND